MGRGRAIVLGLYSKDPVLSWIGSIGLALVCGSALIVDLDSPGNGERSVETLLTDGPRLEEISPARTGVGVLRAGDIDHTELQRALQVLGRSWPALVVRADGSRWDGATVPYQGLYPGVLRRGSSLPAVWQRVDRTTTAPGPGPVLPRIGPRSVRLLLDSRRPLARRWVRSWRQVWEMPWA